MFEGKVISINIAGEAEAPMQSVSAARRIMIVFVLSFGLDKAIH